MRRKLILSWSEAVVNEAGNLLTIFLFPFNKKRQARKNLFLVMNMAFADLLLGGVCLPLFVYVLATRNQFVLPAFLKLFLTVSSQASFITTAALISAERFYAIYWPLKHRTLSTRAYRLFIWTAWILAILVSTICVLPFLSPMAVYTLSLVYTAFFFLWLSAAWTSAFGESFSKELFLVTKTEPCKFSV